MAKEPVKEQPYVVTRQMWLSDWPVLLLLLLDLLFAVWVAPRLPQWVPIHWSASGSADQYANPWAGAFLAPVVNTGLYAFLLYGPQASKPLAEMARSRVFYRRLRWLTAFGVVIFHVVLMLRL